MSTITVHTETDPNGHLDVMYVHGADIADPENDPAAIVDDSTDPATWSFAIEVEPSEDEAPYRAALDENGLTVVGTTQSGDWIVEQVGALASIA